MWLLIKVECNFILLIFILFLYKNLLIVFSGILNVINLVLGIIFSRVWYFFYLKIDIYNMYYKLKLMVIYNFKLMFMMIIIGMISRYGIIYIYFIFNCFKFMCLKFFKS